MALDYFGWNIATIALGIGVLTLVWALMVGSKKKDKRNILVGITVIAGFVFLLPIFTPIAQLTATLGQGDVIPQIGLEVAGGVGAVAGAGPISNALCGVKTTVTASGINKYTGTAVGGTHAYRIGATGPLQYVADAGTFTASACDTLELLWVNGSNKAGYWSDKRTETIPAGSEAFVLKTGGDLIANNTPTITIYNDKGSAIDSGFNNLTLGANDVRTVKMEIRGVSQTGYPYGGIVLAEFNKTAFDSILIDCGDKTMVSTPAFYPVGSTLRTTNAYKLPAILDTQTIECAVTFDVSSSDITSSQLGNGVNVSIYGSNPWIDTKDASKFKDASISDSSNNYNGLGTTLTNIPVI